MGRYGNTHIRGFISAFIFALIPVSEGQLGSIVGISIDNNMNPDDVGFYLYKNPDDLNDEKELEYLNVASIKKSKYDRSKPVILMTHGFTQTYKSQFPYYVKKAYLEAGYADKANIIAVDWGKLSGRYNVTGLLANASEVAEIPAFIQAKRNVYVVGKRIQEFLVFLIKNKFLSGGDKVHLVGQSLGAHASGMAGYYFKNATSTLIGRITGTDPAGPLFQFALPDARLDETDAKFVDIVHTNAGILGYFGSLGHVDFKLNDGPIQPPCKANITDIFCSHNLAARYFANSISDNFNMEASCSGAVLPGLSACMPPNTIFGEHCPPKSRGSYNITMDL